MSKKKTAVDTVDCESLAKKHGASIERTFTAQGVSCTILRMPDGDRRLFQFIEGEWK